MDFLRKLFGSKQSITSPSSNSEPPESEGDKKATKAQIDRTKAQIDKRSAREIDVSLRAFRAAEPSILEDDGVIVARAAAQSPDSPFSYSVGNDSEPARRLLGIPGATQKLKLLCSEEEFERLLIVAEDVTRPEWYKLLVDLATPKAIGSLMHILTVIYGVRDEAPQKLAVESLKVLGHRAYPRLLRGFCDGLPSESGYIAPSYRRWILDVLRDTGDKQCLETLESHLKSYPYLDVRDETKFTIDAIKRRLNSTNVSPSGSGVPEIVHSAVTPIPKDATVDEGILEKALTIEGTAWSGIDNLERHKVMYRFESGGVLSYSYSGQSYRNGTWNQNGHNLYFEINGKFRETDAIVKGDTITGNSKNRLGNTWKTILYKE